MTNLPRRYNLIHISFLNIDSQFHFLMNVFFDVKYE